MGVMVSNNQTRNSQLNQRIASDLRQKSQAAAPGTKPSSAALEDDAYIEGTKKTGRFTWVWIVLIVLALLSAVFILFF